MECDRWSSNLRKRPRIANCIQAKDLFATQLIDDVIIGNAYASEEELRSLSLVNRYQLAFNVRYVPDINPIEKEIVENTQHFRRGDMNNII